MHRSVFPQHNLSLRTPQKNRQSSQEHHPDATQRHKRQTADRKWRHGFDLGSSPWREVAMLFFFFFSLTKWKRVCFENTDNVCPHVIEAVQAAVDLCNVAFPVYVGLLQCSLFIVVLPQILALWLARLLISCQRGSACVCVFVFVFACACVCVCMWSTDLWANLATAQLLMST